VGCDHREELLHRLVRRQGSRLPDLEELPELDTQGDPNIRDLVVTLELLRVPDQVTAVDVEVATVDGLLGGHACVSFPQWPQDQGGWNPRGALRLAPRGSLARYDFSAVIQTFA